MRCLGCKYELEGIRVRKCPECGRGFDPKDPTSYGGEGSSWEMVGQALWVGLPPVVLGLVQWGLGEMDRHVRSGVVDAFVGTLAGIEVVAVPIWVFVAWRCCFDVWRTQRWLVVGVIVCWVCGLALIFGDPSGLWERLFD